MGTNIAKGMVAGFAATVVLSVLMVLMVMPMAGAGLFGLHLGIGVPVVTLMLHWVFGIVLGIVYARLAVSVPVREGRHSHA